MSLYVPAVSPRSRAQIEQEAQVIIGRFYPDLLREPGRFPVLDFFDLLKDEFGLEPCVEQLSDGVEGITWPDGRVVLSEQTYRGASEGDGRSRFTVVHEGYHGIRHRREIRTALVHTGELVLYRRSSIPAYRDPEWQAHTFASAALMPEPMVRLVAASTPRIQLAWKVQNVFGVSNRAAEVRLSKLGL
jgi:hypothetical protein